MSMVGSPTLKRLGGRGQIQLILGPMFSGKTTELMRLMKRHQVANRSCLMVKYSKDDRYNTDSITTHDMQVTKAVRCLKLNDLRSTALQYGVIGIDEAQFFPDIVQFCEDLANSGKMVIVAALDGTFQRKPFGSILDLIPLSENVTKLKAVCMNCFQDASFSKRIGSETEVEVIGGADKYMAVCRECYHLPNTSNHTPWKPPLDDETHGRELFPDSPTKLW